MSEKIDLEGLARAIAAHLDGGTWKVGGVDRDWVALTGPNGAEITLAPVWAGEGRLAVEGRYPRDHHNRYVLDAIKRYNEALPSITVSASRQPKDLAADIARRFIPVYLGYLVKAQQEVARRKAYEHNREALLAVACGVLGTRQYGQETDYKRSTRAVLAPGVEVEVEVSDKAEVKLTISGIVGTEEVRQVLDKVSDLAKLLRGE